MRALMVSMTMVTACIGFALFAASQHRSERSHAMVANEESSFSTHHTSLVQVMHRACHPDDRKTHSLVT